MKIIFWRKMATQNQKASKETHIVPHTDCEILGSFPETVPKHNNLTSVYCICSFLGLFFCIIALRLFLNFLCQPVMEVIEFTLPMLQYMDETAEFWDDAGGAERSGNPWLQPRMRVCAANNTCNFSAYLYQISGIARIWGSRLIFCAVETYLPLTKTMLI